MGTNLAQMEYVSPHAHQTNNLRTEDVPVLTSIISLEVSVPSAQKGHFSTSKMLLASHYVGLMLSLKEEFVIVTLVTLSLGIDAKHVQWAPGMIVQ